MVRLHEILKIVADLQQRGELELAQRVAGQYMEPLDSGELRFQYLVITAKLGDVDTMLDQMLVFLAAGHWFSPWFLQRDEELSRLASLPRFQSILQACSEKEAQYWQSGEMAPILQVPNSAPPYPLLVAIHANGGNAQHSAASWAPAVEAGWLVFHPLAKRLVGNGQHWWDTHEENREIITKQAGEILNQYPIDPDRVILCGFSKGGETAMVLTLLEEFGAKGFITVGAGGYYHMQPELWQPLLASPQRNLRGLAMYSPYDLERSEAILTLDRFQAAGIEIRLETYCAEGHVFPDDLAARFQGAVEFVTRTRSETEVKNTYA